MTNPWFKFYGGEYLTDLKMKSLCASKRSCWITLLSYASQSNGIVKYLSEEQLKIDAGIPVGSEEFENTKNVLQNFEKLEMITVDNGTITVKNWQKRQEVSLTPYERVKRYREKKRNDNEVITDDNANDNDRIEEKQSVIINDNARKDEKRERTPTPSQIAKSFFGGNTKEMFDAFSKGQDVIFIEKEFKKFILYWTEPNKSGTKVRWEQQQTFDVKRRLWTWLNNSKQFNKTATTGRGLA